MIVSFLVQIRPILTFHSIVHAYANKNVVPNYGNENVYMSEIDRHPEKEAVDSHYAKENINYSREDIPVLRSRKRHKRRV
jgi:hypothetical protein